jgi:putative ABC transport system substrate-binding protein
MKRREFIGLVGGAATAWPVMARAQQRSMPLIGFLDSRSPEALTDRLRGFRQCLKDSGYVDGENVVIVHRWAENQLDRLSALANELVGHPVAVIASSGGLAVTAASKAATTTIPIVFIVGQDPVRLGFVASLARPGGNLTGVNFFNNELDAKRLALLREVVPQANNVTVLINPANTANSENTLREVEPAARTMGLQIQVVRASTSHEIDAGFAMLARARPDALFVGNDPFFNTRRVQLALLAGRHGFPAISPEREYAEAGGLMSYGSDIVDAYRQLGAYAGRILKGVKPADMPVVQASKFELVINHQTARLLGLTLPQTLLARADVVIE